MAQQVRRLETMVDEPRPPLVDYAKLEPHPLANLMPMMGDEEFEGLKQDILKNGLQVKMRTYQGKLLDGRNRHLAIKSLAAEGKLAFKSDMFEEFVGTAEQAEAFVFSTNFNRRQLTSKQKREVIKTMITKYPEKSNRKIAELCSTSHSLVGSVREEMREPDKKAREEFEAVCSTFDNWPDKYRTDFVQRFRLDLRELLA
jgi:hypothetical protein